MGAKGTPQERTHRAAMYKCALVPFLPLRVMPYLGQSWGQNFPGASIAAPKAEASEEVKAGRSPPEGFSLDLVSAAKAQRSEDASGGNFPW